MAESSVARFIMHGAREAMAGGMRHIEETVTAIEHAIEENPGLAFDLAKTLIESTCKTILTERSIDYNRTDDLPRLFRTTTDNLPFLPPSASATSKVRRSLKRTLNGLHTAVLGVCELRNACGIASHGSDSTRPVMEDVQALLVVDTADAIVGFLHRVHRQEPVQQSGLPLEYDDNRDFNEHVDAAHSLVSILSSEFKPSEVLFQMEPETYRVALVEFRTERSANEGAHAERNGET